MTKEIPYKKGNKYIGADVIVNRFVSMLTEWNHSTNAMNEQESDLIVYTNPYVGYDIDDVKDALGMNFKCFIKSLQIITPLLDEKEIRLQYNPCKDADTIYVSMGHDE